MKPQDIFFIIIFAGLLITRKSIWFAYAGLGCLIVAIPLFAKWVFFTAERLTWYAAAFILAFVLISLFKPHKVQ